MSDWETDRLKEDLRLTIKELSKTYEELSLLYRLTEQFSGATVDELCGMLIDEIKKQLNVETIAVMFYDKSSDLLFTKKAIGRWNSELNITPQSEFLWKVLKKGKSSTICDVSTVSDLNRLGFKSVILSPLIGKKKTIGLIIVSDKKDGNEFFAGDVKLLNTISSFTAIFIENALLTEEIQEFYLGTIRSFVKALEARSLWTAGHTERVTHYALAIGRQLGLSEKELERLRICSLLHDVGKIAIPDSLLNKMDKLDEKEWEEVRRHPLIGAEILSGLSGFYEVIDCVRYHHEHFDGTGLLGLKGEEIPLLARVLAVADAFDAITYDRPYRMRRPKSFAIEEIKRYSGRQFDPQVVKAFLNWIESSDNIVVSNSEAGT
ncbi:MAG: HD domain-containing protein [Nitrospirae bacterium]|nr:HD domain-containing protein [Nitrospirota bacterium]